MNYDIIDKADVPEGISHGNRQSKWMGLLDPLPVDKAIVFEHDSKEQANAQRASIASVIRQRDYKLHSRIIPAGEGKVTLYIWKEQK